MVNCFDIYLTTGSLNRFQTFYLKDTDGKVVMDVLPGDPIVTLDGRPFVPKKNLDENGMDY